MKKVILLISLVFLVSGCVGQTAQVTDIAAPKNIDTESQSPEPASIIESETGSNTVEIDMIARQWEFIPSTINVNQGDTVILHITSEDVAHGIFLAAFGISERLEPGETTTIQFDAKQIGSHPFTCSVFCGSGHGRMTGTINVV